jgi:hypothetical protein
VWFVATALSTALAASARADFLIYDLGAEGQTLVRVAEGGRSLDRSAFDTRIVLQGKVVVNPGGTVSYTHSSGKKVHFKLGERIEYKKAPTTREEFGKMLGAAGRNTDAIMKAGVWALKKALLPDFYRAVDKVLDIDPKHEAALKVMELRKEMKEPLPDDSETERKFRSIVQRPGMKIAKSNHFILMHDTPSKPEGKEGKEGKKKSRAQERLDLLEKVYESFLLLFHAQDVQLDIPKERMMVVLFQRYDDFHEYARDISPSLASAAGFWEQIRNVSYFYDHGTTERFKLLEQIMKEKRKEMEQAKKWKDPDTIRYVQVLELLMEVERENSDITVVSHECTHQMAGNTGLFPRHVGIPSWVHEGLATYFEAPGDGAWAGIGAVSIERLVFYRALADNDRVHSNIDFIVGDQIFDYARNLGATLHGYAQAWALTHFLIENHIKEFAAFYRMLGEMPPDVRLNPDLLKQLFSRVFGSDHKPLDQEWRSYMRNVKTDMEKLEDSGK